MTSMMEESARKGLELLKLNGTDATSQKKCTHDGRRRLRLRMIAVSGFDSSLPRDENKMRLKKHFSSCGEVWDVSIVGTPGSIALIRLVEGALDKALELSGSDMDGCKIVVDYVFPLEPIPRKRFRTFSRSMLYDKMGNKKKKEDLDF